ncbi:MAG: hypothetical protein U9O53_05085 [archaeon]|nr:hypothetical protein [archaeon]
MLDFLRTIPALFGEIFVEEQRSTSAAYEGIARAIACGCVVSGEISSYLFSRKLINKDDPSIIQQYLKNLEAFGIIKKIEVYNKNRFVYKHVSPLLKLFYYADEKYNISERYPDEKEIDRIIEYIMPRIIEDEMRAFFAKKYGLKESVFKTADFDVDVCLLKIKKPEVVAEIKWKTKVRAEDIKKTEANLSKFKVKKKIMFVPDKTGLKSDVIDIIDVNDLMTL